MSPPWEFVTTTSLVPRFSIRSTRGCRRPSGRTVVGLAARQGRGGVGRALGLNTLGGALAPLLFGVWFLPALGAKHALVLVAVGYLLLIPEFRPRRLPLIFIGLPPGDVPERDAVACRERDRPPQPVSVVTSRDVDPHWHELVER